MFDEKMQKGLFTFYWEANQKEKVMDEASVRSQEGLKDGEGGFKKEGRIEEKQIRKKHHKTEKIDHETFVKHQDYQPYSFAKENKSLLVPHHVTLSPALEHTSRDKKKKKESKVKHTSEPLQIKVTEQKTEVQEKLKNVVQRLHFLDQPVECHKKTLVIDESQFLAKSSYISTTRPMKPKKSMLKEHHQIEEKVPSNHKLPIIKTPQESPNPSTRLPHLFGKHSTKKLKTCKENYFIEKIFAQKHLSASNSIVNIGISSTDEYKIRWKKRKEEFLSLLTKNFSKEDSGVQ